MSISKLHIFSKNTDANASLRGYQYQILKTLETWLYNSIHKIDEEIYCDYEDDIFQKNELSKTAIFRQLKLYSSNFSFKSEEIEKCIAHFFMLHVKTDYTNLDKEFIFEANSAIANKYADNEAELLRKWFENQDKLTPEILLECSNKVKEIVSNYIQDQAKALKDKVDEKIIAEALEVLKNITNEEWNEFTKRIKWRFLCVTPDIEFQAVKERIEGLITSLPFPVAKDEVSSVFGLLTNVVWSKASEPNPDNRKLQISELDYHLISIGTDDDKWYLNVFEKWKDVKEIDHFLIGEFFEVIDAAKHCRRNKYLFDHSPIWINLLDIFIHKLPIEREFKLKAIYEHIWLRIQFVGIYEKPKGNLKGSEDYVRNYFSNIYDFRNASEIEDAQSILNIALTACFLKLADIKLSEVKVWFKQIEEAIKEQISKSKNPSETCHLLENLATYNLFFLARKKLNKNYQSFQEPLEQLLLNIDKAEYYNVSQLCDRLNAYIKMLISISSDANLELIEIIESYLQKLDGIVLKREGNYKAAKIQIDRGIQYLKSDNPTLVLKALNCFHKAKDFWHQQETIEGLVLALINISQLYSGIGLNMAAKYYALAGVWVSVHNGSNKLFKRIADSLGMLFYADFKQGAWMNTIIAFQKYMAARHEFKPNYIGNYEEEMPLKIIADFTLLLYSSPILSPELKVLIDSELAQLGYIKDEFINPLLPGLVSDFPTDNSMKGLLEGKLTDRPLNDIGTKRIITFNALGSTWNISFNNDYNTNAIGEEFCAILQIMLGEIALSKYDFHLVKSAIELELEIKDGVNPPEQLPSHSKFKWKIFSNYFEGKDPKEINFHTATKAGTLMIILNAVSLLPDDEFKRNFESLFKENNLATKTLSMNAYQKMYRMVFNEAGFNSLQRQHFNPIQTPFLDFPTENDVLKWKSDLSLKYNQEQSLKYIGNRFKYSKKCIHLTISKLHDKKEFQELIIKLRRDGWQDWFIILTIMNFILNYKADRELRTMNIEVEDDRMKMFQDLFFKYQNMDEKDCYIEFPVEAFKSPEFDFQLQNTCVTILKACGFENKASFPNFKAVKEFLNLRFNMSIDKNDEDNPLVDIK